MALQEEKQKGTCIARHKPVRPETHKDGRGQILDYSTVHGIQYRHGYVTPATLKVSKFNVFIAP